MGRLLIAVSVSDGATKVSEAMAHDEGAQSNCKSVGHNGAARSALRICEEWRTYELQEFTVPKVMAVPGGQCPGYAIITYPL